MTTWRCPGLRPFLLAVAAFHLGIQALPARAQVPVDKDELRLVVGFAPGGNVDWVARTVSEALRLTLGKKVIVENKPGAGGRIALAGLTRMPADGSVLAVTVDAPLTLLPFTVANLEYNPVKDFTPVARIAVFDYAIAVASAHPARTLREYMEWLAKNPKDATYGSPGSGSGPSFLGDAVAKAYNVQLTDVPYRGGAPMNTDLLGGTLRMGIGVLPDMLELHRGGKLRVLAVGSAQRSTLVPEVHTIRESGVDFEGEISVALYGPAGLTAPYVAALHKALSGAFSAPDMRAKFEARGMTVSLLPAPELAALQAADTKTWQKVVKASGYVAQ
jgi:tripartite-type tricarboxylate transporter receptor subunit TctC